MNEDDIKLKIIEWYNFEKITITGNMKELNVNYPKYKDCVNRIIEIDKILFSLTK